MVIIEILKSEAKENALLGLHKWSEFLKNPGSDEKDKESRVYYCTHENDRKVQKSGE